MDNENNNENKVKERMREAQGRLEKIEKGIPPPRAKPRVGRPSTAGQWRSAPPVGRDLTRDDFFRALGKVSQPVSPQHEKEKSETSE